MIASLISVTPNAEKIMAYVARVSNPSNQNNDNFEKLMAYCIAHKHWSVFETASMTIEVNTNLAIATQMLRHRSFNFQQFSQRYSDSMALSEKISLFELREQDISNRQNSTDTLSPDVIEAFQERISTLFSQIETLYSDMLMVGVAKECARFILPQATPTRIYVTGNVRSWLHYIDLRTGMETQKEHRDVALACKEIFQQQFPTVSSAMGWKGTT